MDTLRNLFRLAAWTFLHPLEIDRRIQATGNAWPARRVWCALSAGLGLILSWAFLDPRDLVWFLLPVALGPVLVLIAALDAKDAHTDALGLMVLALLSWGLAFPAAKMQATGSTARQFALTAPYLAVFIGGLAAGALLAKTAMNRSYLFLPIGLAAWAAQPVHGLQPWVLTRLGAVAGPPPELALPVIAAVFLFVLRMAGSQIVIRSFQHLSNTESCTYLTLAAFRRAQALVYGVLGLASLLATRWLAAPPRSYAMPIVFLAMAAFELDLPQTLVLSLRRGSWPGLLFRIPGVPLPPPGLAGYLARLKEQRGNRAAGSLAADLLLRTGYRRSAEATIAAIRQSDWHLGVEIGNRLAAEWPRDPREEGPRPPERQAAARTISRAVRPALAIPQLSPHDFAGAAFGSLLLTKRYEAPRGKEGAPLAALPLWFPVAEPPMETMTLPQVVYRSLASVREPFRRTQIVLSQKELVRDSYTELLDWAVRWAASSLGASLVPVALSLQQLVANQSRLVSVADEVRRSRAGSGGEAGSAVELTRAGCAAVITLGSKFAPADVSALTAAVEAGNAWLLVEDDREGKGDLKPLRKALDLIFGTAGLSHAAILVVTAARDCRLLSDMQSFRAETPPGPVRRDPGSSAVPGRLAAALCRRASSWGSPSMRAALWTGAILAVVLLVCLVAAYEQILPLLSAAKTGAGGIGAGGSGRLKAILGLGAVLVWVFLPFVIAYTWGLAHGSEEVRKASVHTLMSAMFAGLLLLLALLPKAMAPGVGKTVLVALAALPGTVVLAVALLTYGGLLADLAWLILSERLSRKVDAAGLAGWTERYRVVLHIGSAGATITLPARPGCAELPVLVSFRNAAVVAAALAVFPPLGEAVRRAVLLGLRGTNPESNPFSYSSSSLLVEALRGDGGPHSRRTLAALGQDFVACWPERDRFAQYHEPSTTFTMNALEYAARRLCHLTNLEDLIVVR